jgi:HSP20 family protein
MFASFSDFGSTFAAMNELRRHVERRFGDLDAPVAAPDGGLRVTFHDSGPALVLMADVPGLSEKDLTITLQDDVLTVTGGRGVAAPQGYAVHRQERRPVRFNRSFALPCPIKVGEVTAATKDGVLTVTLPKAPEAQPRQITVKAG